MYMGAAEDEGRNADPAVAMAKLELAKAAGFDTIRITAIWAPGQSAVPRDQLAALTSVAAAADFLGIRIVATVQNFGNRTTPLSATARTQFARFTANMVRRLPTIREYIIGNEPNLNRYWMPQFGPNGENIAAPAYVRLLARTYDAMKAVDKHVFVIGGSVSPRGIDKPGTGRDTHSPTKFITDMGIAYRALKRNKPIMDGFAFHPYGENSSTPPTVAHPNSTAIGLADYPKLVSLLAKAFDGTAQLGSKLPIVYDEYGVDSQIPDGKRHIYSGRELSRPVSEGVQASYYRQALAMAACQPTVRGFLIFHVTDETDFGRWQSGVYFPDGTAKSSRPLVRQSMSQIRSGAIACEEPEPPFVGPGDGWSTPTAAEIAAAEQGSEAVGDWVLVSASD